MHKYLKTLLKDISVFSFLICVNTGNKTLWKFNKEEIPKIKAKEALYKPIYSDDTNIPSIMESILKKKIAEIDPRER